MSGFRVICLFATTLLLSFSGAQAQDYPFVGRWDCEGATFSFTETSYNGGMGAQAIASIEAEGSGFILTLANEQEVIVSEFNDGKMVWLYWSSGERRVCQKLD
jgi:hypothetical protein